MNYADLRGRAAFLGQMALNVEENPAADWAALINTAYADFSWETEFNEEQTSFTTVTNQAEYPLPWPYFKAIKECAYISQSQTGNGLRMTRSSELEESQRDPLWFTRPMGIPSRFLTPRPNVVRLVDMPSTSGDTVTIRGSRQAPPLVNDGDTPLFPDTWHEALALKAAIYYCEPLLDGADAAKLEMYRGQWVGMVAACKAYIGTQRYGVLRRQVQRGYRGRVANIGYGNY